MMSSKKNWPDFAAGVYQSLQTGDTVSQVGIFDPALWTVAPVTFSLVQLSPVLTFPVWLSIRRINTCRKVPFQVNSFRWQRFALPSMSLIFLRVTWSLTFETRTHWQRIFNDLIYFSFITSWIFNSNMRFKIIYDCLFWLVSFLRVWLADADKTKTGWLRAENRDDR